MGLPRSTFYDAPVILVIVVLVCSLSATAFAAPHWHHHSHDYGTYDKRNHLQAPEPKH
jgi:hypothetical protein